MVSKVHNLCKSGLYPVDCKSTQTYELKQIPKHYWIKQSNVHSFPQLGLQIGNEWNYPLHFQLKSHNTITLISTIPPSCQISSACLMLACRLPPADWTQDRARWLAGPTHTTHPRNPEAGAGVSRRWLLTPRTPDNQDWLYSGKCQEAGSEKRRGGSFISWRGYTRARACCPAKQIIGLWSKL